MPELPEVETMRRGVRPVTGCRIDAVQFVRNGCKPIRVSPRRDLFRRRIAGQQIVDVGRVGKRVVLQLANGENIVIEPRMTGLVLLSDPPSQEHLRIGFRLSGGAAEWIWYWDRRGLGSVRLFSPSQLQRELGPGRLGPDALGLVCDQLRNRLAASRRAIKVALLDQKALAGIGNLYASEILHVARIHPAHPCNRLAARQWTRLHRAMQEVLSEAIRYEGSTLSDGTYRNALNQRGRYQNQHRVYGRPGEACLQCQVAKIQRIVQAQRSTFFCPGCQRPENNSLRRSPG
jgi:formamidopyrimidine-DNA glycosylase